MAAVDVLLCDADGCLFPSEEPAFVASAEVTNRFLQALGVDRRYGAEELRRATTGKNFRTTAVDLAAAAGVRLEPVPSGYRGAVLRTAELERWVAEEREAVTAHLGRVLKPDPAVTGPVSELAGRVRLAVVSSSAQSRVDACLAATGLAELFPAERRFSAEDSLPEPRSKPDPAIYALAGEVLGVDGDRTLAVEDSLPGVEAAVAAGFPVLGQLGFVPAPERRQRGRALLDAGAAGLVGCWGELAACV
jgi:beta-phosphoglucomutase-like phosphatase (HAD superfamily)